MFEHGVLAGWSRALLVGVIAALVLAQAGVVSAQSPDAVRDFAAIQAGELTVLLDPSGTAATIEVTTSLDAACAVVFGEDGSFGRIATDRDMGGGAHRDHGVLLGDLRPDTVYLFRFQGSGADGRLYRSEVMSLRTPPAPASSMANVAVGSRIVEVSSEFSPAYAGENAIDGDLATEWSSSGDGDDAFITLDLGRPVSIASVAFRTREMSDGSAITTTFMVVADGDDFGPFPAGTEPAPLEAVVQVLRFEVAVSTGGNTGAVEIEVFEAP